jgi:predicted phage baseplate assembly protein
VWVRWKERPHLFDADSGDRVYTLDRVGGLLRFGDGRRGLVPPPGAPIAATFSTGGGLAGNVPAGSVTEPRAAIPFLGSVTNPLPARGGSPEEPRETTRLRGAHRLRHRGRALTPADFEWLAVEASPAVARARCLPVTGDAGSVQRGWVTVVIVPHSTDRRPQPDDEMTARVRAYLRDRAPATLADRIRVIGPDYLPISVVAEIVPMRPDQAEAVETAVRKRLDDFLHPLRGGRDARGWQVGQGVALSQVAAFVEGTPGVDFAREIGLRVEDAVYGDEVPGRPDKLVAPGEHELRLTLRGEAC